MEDPARDVWSEWFLHSRYGDDPKLQESILRHLYPIRDKILQRASLRDGETLLDVGCGNGFLGFRALEQVPTGKVVFSDISGALLREAEAIGCGLGILDRCRFLQASADDLSPLSDASVDVLVARSVLIFVKEKHAAFEEFHRVLGPGGRLSVFEPIDPYFPTEPPNMFMGIDVSPVMDLAAKVKVEWTRLQQPESAFPFTCGERDLVRFAQEAGFREIHLECRIDIKPLSIKRAMNWDAWLRLAASPHAPTMEQLLKSALSPDEYRVLTLYLKTRGEKLSSSAVAYLWAIK